MAHSRSLSEPDAVRSQGTGRFSNSQSLNEPNRIAVRQQLGRLSAVREDPDIQDFPQRSALVVEEEPDYVQPSLPGSGLRMSRRSLNIPARVMASSGALQGHLDDDHLTDTSSAVSSPPSYRPIPSVSGSVRRPMGRNYAQNIPSAVVEESNFDGEMSTLTSISSAGRRRSYK